MTNKATNPNKRLWVIYNDEDGRFLAHWNSMGIHFSSKPTKSFESEARAEQYLAQLRAFGYLTGDLTVAYY